ncbi:hypothetical protein AC578_9907 [Pseudocercospora eumusae]|uniref:Uncharacterized protein n=1 Tax=Pseudocercospora eumusae TaxID=321146 RepID=A0A139HB93_9PEZI|nr:hypothetical protein AC578_9907 [Pseudocercospora eumusae]
MTKQMAIDYAKDRIHVNAVCPGFVETPMIGHIIVDEQLAANLSARHPWNARRHRRCLHYSSAAMSLRGSQGTRSSQMVHIRPSDGLAEEMTDGYHCAAKYTIYSEGFDEGSLGFDDSAGEGLSTVSIGTGLSGRIDVVSASETLEERRKSLSMMEEELLFELDLDGNENIESLRRFLFITVTSSVRAMNRRVRWTTLFDFVRVAAGVSTMNGERLYPNSIVLPDNIRMFPAPPRPHTLGRSACADVVAEADVILLVVSFFSVTPFTVSSCCQDYWIQIPKEKE